MSGGRPRRGDVVTAAVAGVVRPEVEGLDDWLCSAFAAFEQSQTFFKFHLRQGTARELEEGLRLMVDGLPTLALW